MHRFFFACSVRLLRLALSCRMPRILDFQAVLQRTIVPVHSMLRIQHQRVRHMEASARYPRQIPAYRALEAAISAPSMKADRTGK